MWAVPLKGDGAGPHNCVVDHLPIASLQSREFSRRQAASQSSQAAAESSSVTSGSGVGMNRSSSRHWLVETGADGMALDFQGSEILNMGRKDSPAASQNHCGNVATVEFLRLLA